MVYFFFVQYYYLFALIHKYRSSFLSQGVGHIASLFHCSRSLLAYREYMPDPELPLSAPSRVFNSCKERLSLATKYAVDTCIRCLLRILP